MNSPPLLGPIVVGVDGSKAALDAVRFAANVARGRRASLRLVHVINPQAQPETVYGAPDVDGDYGRAVLREAAAAATDIDATVMLESLLLHGQPEIVLLGETRSASLLALGTGVGSELPAHAMESLAFSLAESAVCPVAIVREHGADPDGAVVVALGDGEVLRSDVVVAEAFREASIRKSDIIGIHARSTSEVLTRAFQRAIDMTPESSTEIRFAPFIAAYPGVSVSIVYAEAGTGSELATVSRSAQLLVVGHERGRTRGNTLSAVLRRAYCPVLVIPHA